MNNDDSPRDPNAAITDALVALDPAHRAFAMAIVDRVSVLAGMTDIRSQERDQVLTGTLARIEEKQDAAAIDRQQVTVFLQGIIVEMGAVSSGLALLTDEFRQLSEWRATVETRLDRKRARMDAIDARVVSIEARLTLGEGRLTQVEARLDALGNPNGG